MPSRPIAGTSAPAATWRRMLEAIPVRNRAARELNRTPDGGAVLAIPTKPKRWYAIPPVRWVVRVPEHRELHLDPVGTALWDRCDGKHTVEDLVDFFAVQNSLTFHESRVSVTTYLRSLLQRGAIAMALD